MELDAVVKLGGSIIRNDLLGKDMDVLEDLAREYNILVVPGGGELADAVRSFDSRYGLSTSVGHWSGIRSMDLNAEMIEDVSSDAETAASREEAMNIMNDDRLCLLKTRKLLEKVEHPHSWDLTSDSIAAIVAGEFNAEKLVVVTDVEGVLSGEELVEEIDRDGLEEMGETCVDPVFPEMLDRYNMDATVVSGQYPERIDDAVEGNTVRGTRIC